MSDIQPNGHNYASVLLSSEEYWQNSVEVASYPNGDVHNQEVAEYIARTVIGNHTAMEEVPSGRELPLPDKSLGQVWLAILDGRMVLPRSGGQVLLDVGAAREGGFNYFAELLYRAGPTARDTPVRMVKEDDEGVVALSRLAVFGCDGEHAPFLGRASHVLLDPTYAVPNMVLPFRTVGQPYRLPSAADVLHQVKIARAYVVTPLHDPEG